MERGKAAKGARTPGIRVDVAALQRLRADGALLLRLQVRVDARIAVAENEGEQDRH